MSILENGRVPFVSAMSLRKSQAKIGNNVRHYLIALPFIAGLFAVCNPAAADPAAEFLSRRLCTVWGGNCQQYRMTVGELENLCKAKGTAQWEITNEKRALLRCNWTDELTRKPNEFAFALEAYELPKIDPKIAARQNFYDGLREQQLDQSITFADDAGKETDTHLTLRQLAELCRDTPGKPWGNLEHSGFAFGCLFDPRNDNPSFAAVTGMAAQGTTLSGRNILGIMSSLDAAVVQATPPSEKAKTTRLFFIGGNCSTYQICLFSLKKVENVDGETLSQSQATEFLQASADKWAAKHLDTQTNSSGASHHYDYAGLTDKVLDRPITYNSTYNAKIEFDHVQKSTLTVRRLIEVCLDNGPSKVRLNGGAFFECITTSPNPEQLILVKSMFGTDPMFAIQGEGDSFYLRRVTTSDGKIIDTSQRRDMAAFVQGKEKLWAAKHSGASPNSPAPNSPTEAEIETHSDHVAGAWTPPQAVFDAPLLIAVGASNKETGITLRELTIDCAQWSGGTVSYNQLRGRQHSFSVKCTHGFDSKNRFNEETYGFVHSVLGDGDAITLVGITFNNTKTGRKVPLDRDFTLSFMDDLAKRHPALDADGGPSHETLSTPFSIEVDGDITEFALDPTSLAGACVQWLAGTITYKVNTLPRVPGSFSLICTTKNPDTYYNEQEFIFSELLGGHNGRTLALAGIANRNTSTKETKLMNSAEIAKTVKAIELRLNEEKDKAKK